jgi:hypothetical protein
MTRIYHVLRGRRAWVFLAMALVGMLIAGTGAPKAHNNPGFKEVLLTTIEVTAEPIETGALAAHSQAFSLDLPKKTIELIWRVAGEGADGVGFSIAQGDALHAEGLHDGGNCRILRGGDIRIVDVTGASGPFSIEVYANVIDRSKPADS